MSIAVFRGIQCEEKPVQVWEHWICTHLKPFINGAATGKPLVVERILVGCNKSSEVFVFVSGALLADIQSSLITPPLTRKDSRISCDTCWVDIYSVEGLKT